MPNVFKANGKDNPVDNYMFKVNNSNIETGCEIYPKLTSQWHRFGVFNVNFVHISDLVLVFLSLALSR